MNAREDDLFRQGTNWGRMTREVDQYLEDHGIHDDDPHARVLHAALDALTGVPPSFVNHQDVIDAWEGEDDGA